MKATVKSRDIFLPSPAAGTGVHASSYYTTQAGTELVSIHGYETRSDTIDVAFVRRSSDNGRTWSLPVEWPTRFDHPQGTGRRHVRGGYVDAATGRYITFWTEGILPTDDPLEGLTHWTLWYSVSEDGGQTEQVREQIIHTGPEFDAVHHLPGVTVGCNCVMMGDLGERPFTRSDGTILVPVQSSPVGPDGYYLNPGRGFTYTDCLLLMGHWTSEGRLQWTVSQRISGDPERTTRGLIEPTIAELADGSLMMVMRGSNDAAPHLPGYKWFSRSCDGGETWTPAEPWTYSDGETFFSPSSCSQLIPWHDGRLLWAGNVCKQNPAGNAPRYPLILAEVDRNNGCLIRDSVNVLDNRGEHESPYLTLSNFYCREDRETGDLILHMSRLFSNDYRQESKADFTADALLYRIEIT